MTARRNRETGPQSDIGYIARLLFFFAHFNLIHCDRFVKSSASASLEDYFLGGGKLSFLWTRLMTFRWPMMMGLAVLTDDTVLITAIKKAEKGNDRIIRLFEPTGRITQVNLLENLVAGRAI